MAQLMIYSPQAKENVLNLITFAAYGYAGAAGSTIYGELLDSKGNPVLTSTVTVIQDSFWAVWFNIQGVVHDKTDYSVRVTNRADGTKQTVGPFQFQLPVDDEEKHHGVSISSPRKGQKVCEDFYAWGGFDAGFYPNTVTGTMVPKQAGTSVQVGPIAPISSTSWGMWFHMGGSDAVHMAVYRLEATTDIGGDAKRGDLKVIPCPQS